MFRFVVALFALGLASCTSSVTPFETPTRSVAPTVATTSPAYLPNLPTVAPITSSVQKSNTQISQDFLALSFALESGTALRVFTRFEGPVTVRMSGQLPATASSDLNALLARLRNEAQIQIFRSNEATANILIEGVTRAEINSLVPNAACFVAPNVLGMNDYLRSRKDRSKSWSALTNRTKMTIFIPNDSGPQETRDCLHEELAQALGPLNDLYYLTDSVFNDDNIHATLTSYDMLILRAYYDPMLSNGMSKEDVAERLPSILSRLNPTGRNVAYRERNYLPRSWNDSIATALGRGASPQDRIRAAETAVALTQSHGVTDSRAAFSYFVLGRVAMSVAPQKSQRAFEMADRIYASHADTTVHRAFVATQLAAYALNEGRADAAIQIVRPYMNVARAHNNAGLLATLMLLEAQALDMKGATAQARSVRLDSMGWARYGFGSEPAVQARMREIAALSPR